MRSSSLTSVEQTEAFLAAAKKAGVEHVVKLSAAGASEDTPAQAIRNHAIAEKRVSTSGLGYTILRPTFFMDNVITFQRESLVNEKRFYGAAGDGQIAYVSSADIGRVAAAVLTDPRRYHGQVLEITGNETLNENQLAALLSDVSRSEIRYVDVGAERHAQSLRDAGTPDFFVEALSFLETVKREGWAQATTATVEEVTGKAPETYASFLAREKAHFSRAP
jgi:uncharacterized protein YbjT (DUF2867 family)